MFDYGWSQEWEGTLKPGLEPCRVTCVRRGCLNLVCRQGAFEAVCKGALLNRIGEQGSMPAVGDWVLAEIPETPQAVALVGKSYPVAIAFPANRPFQGGGR